MSDAGLVDRYLDEMAKCTTVNQFNRVHIHIEIHYSPQEVCGIIDGVRARGVPLAPPCDHWLTRMDGFLRGDGRAVQPYGREPITRAVTFYAAPGDAATRARRRLIVAFAGDAKRLMMPVSAFLQHCPADRFEVLLLMDFKQRFYVDGVEGFGNDMPGTHAAIAARFPRTRLRRAMSFGTSAGGLAAIWTAVALGLPRAVAVGGVTPEEIATRELTSDLDTSGFAEAVRRNAGRLPEVVMVSGALRSRDTRKALVMEQFLPVTNLQIPGGRMHNVLFDVWVAGGLDRLMERLLGDEPVTADDLGISVQGDTRAPALGAQDAGPA